MRNWGIRESGPPKGDPLGNGDAVALELKGVKKAFGKVEVIKGCDLSVHYGEVLALVGGNGAGKTTIFNLISGVLRCDDGQIWLQGRDVTGLVARRISGLGLGRTFQDVRLFRSMTAWDNVQVSVEDRLFSGRSDPAVHRVIGEALEAVGLSLAADTCVDELSYAEQKFVGIARILARKPTVVLLDEPASGLDVGARERLAGIISYLHEGGVTVMLVEHNLEFVLSTASEVAFLDYGVVRAKGRPSEVMKEPDLVEAYFGA